LSFLIFRACKKHGVANDLSCFSGCNIFFNVRTCRNYVVARGF